MVDLARARALLGRKGENMTDEQVMALVNQLRVLADIVIDQVISMPPQKKIVL